ncbi:MAG: pyruvate kinase [Planctomycetota bacterium]|nr:pyruvate kinase [Planctomycetota bacterium]
MSSTPATIAARPTIRKHARTKIISTIGPACSQPAVLQDLVLAGTDVFRLNMAHGTRDQHDQAVQAVRQIDRQLDHPLGILVDLAGPKIRLGELPGGTFECQPDSKIRFVRGDTIQRPNELVTNYERLVDELDEGDLVVLADATVELVVESRTQDYAECRVVQAGRVGSRQGVNLPGVRLSVPAMDHHDREAAQWAAAREADFISLSFVRSPNDLIELKQLLNDVGSQALVIAKIEKAEALEELEAIVEVADGVMVARGDLGVEIDIARVPLVQKQIIEACNRRNKPVIVATQMLASMQSTRHPTRAEVTDVANAILDGSDACMLSGETAVGQYPGETVRMMNRIALVTESEYRGRHAPRPEGLTAGQVHQITLAVVSGAARIATQLDASLLVVASRSGATALTLSKRRPFTPIIGISQQQSTLRKMSLYWGIAPVHGAPFQDLAALKRFVSDWGKKDGFLADGDSVVIVAGTGVTPDMHNAVEVHEV